MSTVLAYTSPALGHLFPMMPLLLELRARGHDVHVRTLASQVAQVRSLGLEAEPIDERVPGVVHDDWEVVSPKEALLHAVGVFAERGKYDGPDLVAAIDAVGPDLVVVDINAWGALVAAEASGLPFVSFSPFTPPLRARGVPPFGPGLKPIAGPVGRLRDAVVRPLVLGVAEKAMCPPANALRAEAGLPPVRTVDEFLRSSDLMLVTTAEPFEYPHPDWGDDIRMIGACAWEPAAEPPAWLAEVDRPLVLVTTSSEYQDDAVLVQTAFDALAEEDVVVVATMPAGIAETIRVPANGRLEEFVPHGPVLDRAAVAITHGGMGATQKALARGVPVVVVPFGRDQLEVAARVSASGSGVRVSPKRLTVDRMRDAVRRARGSAGAARSVAEGYAAAGGAAAAADAIEGRFVAGRDVGGRP